MKWDESQAPRFHPKQRLSNFPDFCRPSPRKLYRLPFHRQPSTELHILDLVYGCSGLLHFLIGGQGFVVFSRHFSCEEGEKADLPVGEGKGDEQRGVRGKGDACRGGFALYGRNGLSLRLDETDAREGLVTFLNS